jgi:putative membrane protein
MIPLLNGTRTALNMLVALAFALKHRLRFEPYTYHADLSGLVGHLDTFAKDATLAESPKPTKKKMLKVVGEYLGVSFSFSNPRKLIKRTERPLGNLPLEIVSHLSVYVEDLVDKEMLTNGPLQALICMYLKCRQFFYS